VALGLAYGSHVIWRNRWAAR